MRIVEISVRGLFGLFDHIIPLNTADRITIIHGPNGFGKTVLLNMVDGLLRRNYSMFRRIPFDQFKIRFDDGRSLLVKRSISARSETEFTISLEGSGTKEKPYTPKIDANLPRRYASIVEDIVPTLHRVSADEWVDSATNTTLSWTDIVDQYGDRLPLDSEYEKEPGWLRSIQDVIDVHFVRTDRLLLHAPVRQSRGAIFRDQAPVPTSAVSRYSQDLAERIQQTLAESAELSQSLDRTFPSRLVERLGRKEKPALSDEQIRRELGQLEEKRERLTEAGLMDKAESDVQIPNQAAIDDLTRIALSIYVRDVEEKLRIFNDILARIGLLQTIINTRYSYSFKRLRIDKNQGFVFETRDGTPLRADALSSGEQHELVLVYELLFRVKPGSLILIDEPELSLHIAWQQVFLRDLTEIAGLTDIDVLIATHSADIIYDRWDLAVELKGPHRDEESL